MATNSEFLPGGGTVLPADQIKQDALAALQRGDNELAIEKFEALLSFAPEHPDVLNALGVACFQTGDAETAMLRLEQARKIAPERDDIKNNLVNVKKAVAGATSGQGQNDIAIQVLRQALAQDPDNAGLRIELSNLLEMTGAQGLLSDYSAELTPEALGSHVLIACMPKSGSSFLKESLRALTGWKELWLSYAYLQNEQELYLPALKEVARDNIVTQQHCRATGPNLNILQGFGIRPIVLTRNLPDIVLSLSDFYDSGATLNTFFGEVWPTLDQAGKHDLIIDHVMPWYAGFKASWERAARHGAVDCHFVSYEEMIADKPGALLRIADFLALGKTDADCAAAVAAVEGDTDKTRFNKGVAGRGAATLTEEQLGRIERLSAAYTPGG